MTRDTRIEAYDGPVGGWGSVGSLARHVWHQAATRALTALPQQNKVGGFACVSCAWAKPARVPPGRVLRKRRQGHIQ
jgi:hypothetical protein